MTNCGTSVSNSEYKEMFSQNDISVKREEWGAASKHENLGAWNNGATDCPWNMRDPEMSMDFISNILFLLLLPWAVTILIGPKHMKHEKGTTQTQEKPITGTTCVYTSLLRARKSKLRYFLRRKDILH